MYRKNIVYVYMVKHYPQFHTLNGDLGTYSSTDKVRLVYS